MQTNHIVLIVNKSGRQYEKRVKRLIELMKVNMELNNKIVIYQAPDGQTELEVRLQEETMWLTQKQIAELFGTDRTVIVRHIQNIYKTEELEEKATCAKIAQVRQEGKRTITRELPFYNLDMIFSVGYGVNSKNATAVRRWANRILKDYLLKGYAVNRNIQLQHYTEYNKKCCA